MTKVLTKLGKTAKRKASGTYLKNTRPLACRVDPDTRREVEEYAAKDDLWLAEAIRQLIEFGLEAVRHAS